MHDRDIQYRMYARNYFIDYDGTLGQPIVRDDATEELIRRASEMFESLVQLRKEQANDPMYINKDIKSHSL